MTDEHDEHRSAGWTREMGWGIPASILLHVVLAFILFFHLPLDVAEPQKEESVSVEIVPPPEEKKAEEPEKKAEEKKSPEQSKEEQPKQEEAKKEEPPPPEPEKKEEAKKEEPPPPPPPPPEPPKHEAEKPEPPPPPKQEETKQEQKPAEEQGQGQPLRGLRSVFQFGEKDAGPRKSENGDAAEEAVKPTEQTEPDVAESEQPKPAEDKPAEEKPAAVAEAPPGNPLPDDVNAPEIDIASANPRQDAQSNGAAPDATRLEIVISPPAASAVKPDPSKPPTPSTAPALKEVKTLFSRSATNERIATMAMEGLSRGERAGELCGTELKQQLRAVSYNPDILPTQRFSVGTLLQTPYFGFRSNGQWYDVSFRCLIDENATKVLSFALDVGRPVPRSEWRKRGFPDF